MSLKTKKSRTVFAKWWNERHSMCVKYSISFSNEFTTIFLIHKKNTDTSNIFHNLMISLLPNISLNFNIFLDIFGSKSFQRAMEILHSYCKVMEEMTLNVQQVFDKSLSMNMLDHFSFDKKGGEISKYVPWFDELLQIKICLKNTTASITCYSNSILTALKNSPTDMKPMVQIKCFCHEYDVWEEKNDEILYSGHHSCTIVSTSSLIVLTQVNAQRE